MKCYGKGCRICRGSGQHMETVHDIRCSGCGGTMRQPVKWRARSCSIRCEQRARRAQDANPVRHRCGRCGMAFVAKRKDADFCSTVCRMRAYRVRKRIIAARSAAAICSASVALTSSIRAGSLLVLPAVP